MSSHFNAIDLHMYCPSVYIIIIIIIIIISSSSISLR